MMGATASLYFILLTSCALLAAWNVCACETVLTHAEISADRSRAVEFFGATAGGQFGWTISAAGDVNGDGFADFVIAAPFERSNAGTVYVIFGRSAADWESAAFDFGSADTADAASWIRITGVNGVHLGDGGIARGDFNGDGLSDLLVSSDNEGRVFCIYGRRGNWSSFSTADVGSAVPGFAIIGGTYGVCVSNAGDLNGDGIEDMQVSAYSGYIAHVVFGVPGATRSSFDTSTVDGSNGFRLTDNTTSIGTGKGMGSVGDVNGDGLADLALGSYSANGNAGRAYILFARNVSATGQQWPASINLLTHIDGTNGFIVDGPSNSMLGHNVMGAGDVNADGFDDVFIGSSSFRGSWVVFGKSTPWASPFSASQLDGSDGFHFASSGESWGISGDGAGDVNGDGINDIVIGGYNAANSLGTSSGAAVILFGRSGSWPAELSRNDAVGSAGFFIDGSSSGSWFGFSSSGVGDVNGDGLADFVVGAPYHNSNAGYAVLVFGVSNDHCAVCSNFTDACLDCDDGFVLNGTFCEAEPLPVVVASSSPSSSDASSHKQGSGSSVVVIIKFNESISDPTELQEEIASVLGIDAGLVSVVVISPTEVEVTIIGGEETAQHLVDIINNGGAGSGDGSGLGLLRKAIDARIRKDDDDGDGGSSGDDGVDAAPQHATMPLLATTVAVACAPADGSAGIPCAIETDIGQYVDDAWALLYALSPASGLDVRLVVTSTNDTVARARIVGKLLAAAGRAHVPIAVGARTSDYAGPQSAWGADYDLSAHPGGVTRDVQGALAGLLANADARVALVELSPPVEFGAFADARPELLAAHALQASTMGGSVAFGYGHSAGAVAEYNVRFNVAASQLWAGALGRLSLPLPHRLAPLDTSGVLRVEGSAYKRLLAGEATRPALAAMLESYRVWAKLCPSDPMGLYCAEGDPAVNSGILYDAQAAIVAGDLRPAEVLAQLQWSALPVAVNASGFIVEDPVVAPQLTQVATDWNNMDAIIDAFVSTILA